MKDEFRRISNQQFGGFGYHCRCCGPHPKARGDYRRMVRHKLKQQDRELIKEELPKKFIEEELNG